MGDFDGDGRADLASGSNCCRHDLVYVFLRQKDGSFAPRQTVRVKGTGIIPDFGRAVACPHLLDWDRDGHTDLVVGYVENWTLYVGAGPLAGKTEVAVKPFALPELPDARPVYFSFADWDGDGRFDLLAALRFQKGPKDPVSFGIYWFRNTAAKGAPTFAAGSRLLTIPAPWVLDGFTVVRGQDGRLDLVLSVSKNFRQNWGRRPDFSIESQLWRYRRKD